MAPVTHGMEMRTQATAPMAAKPITPALNCPA